MQRISYFREDFPKVALYPREGNSFPKCFSFSGEDFPRSADYLTSRPLAENSFSKYLKCVAFAFFEKDFSRIADVLSLPLKYHS